jgi:hypothetical protein
MKKLTQKELETRLAEVMAKIAEHEEVSSRNSERCREAKAKLMETLTEHLEKAGFLNASINIYSFENPPDVNVQFGHSNDNYSSLNITFKDHKVTRYSVEGWSNSGQSVDIADAYSYYSMVADVMKKLMMPDSASSLGAFFDTIDNFKEPEMEPWPDYNMAELRREKACLEGQLRVIALDLKPGKIIEYFDERRGRRGAWFRVEVVCVTPKMLTFKFAGSNYECRKALNPEYFRPADHTGEVVA